MRTPSATLCAALILAVVPGCGGSGSLPASRLTTTETEFASNAMPAPASFAAIKPAPGYPSPPPAGRFRIDPATEPTPSPVRESLPLPPGIGKLSATITPAQQAQVASLLPAESTKTVVEGTITSFGSNRVSVAVEAPIASDTASHYPTVPVKGGVAIPSTLTLVLAPTTVDAVPGGFGGLHKGDAILALADVASPQLPAIYLTDLTLLAKDVAAISSSPPPFAESLENAASARSAPAAAGAIARRIPAVNFPNSSPFLLAGDSSPATNYTKTTNLPLPFAAYLPFCVVTMTLNSVLVDFGTDAEYPLRLADVSSKVPSIENQTSTLPLSVLNVPSDGSATFTANAYVALDIHLSATLSPGIANLTGQKAPIDFSLADVIGPELSNGTHLLPGLGMQSGTTEPLPAQGDKVKFDVVRGLGLSIDPAGQFISVILDEYPFIAQKLGEKGFENLKFPITTQFQLDGGIEGGPVNGQLFVTAGTPNVFSHIEFQPDAVPGSAEKFTPLAPGGGTMANRVTLQRDGNDVPYGGTVSLQTNLVLSTPLRSLPPDPIAVYSPGPFAFQKAIFRPGLVELTLRPSPAPTISCNELAPQHPTNGTCGFVLQDPKAVDFHPGFDVGKISVSETGYSGPFTWNPAAPGRSPNLPTYENPACTNKYFKAAFTESPSTQSGKSVVFTFKQTQNLYGPEPNPNKPSVGGSAACDGVIVDAKGRSVGVSVNLEWGLTDGQKQP